MIYLERSGDVETRGCLIKGSDLLVNDLQTIISHHLAFLCTGSLDLCVFAPLRDSDLG